MDVFLEFTIKLPSHIMRESIYFFKIFFVHKVRNITCKLISLLFYLLQLFLLILKKHCKLSTNPVHDLIVICNSKPVTERILKLCDTPCMDPERFTIL